MTREEVIKGLKMLRRDFSGYKPNEEMFDLAINTLEKINDCDETSATKCFTCINEIKERYFNDSKRISKSDKSII